MVWKPWEATVNEGAGCCSLQKVTRGEAGGFSDAEVTDSLLKRHVNHERVENPNRGKKRKWRQKASTFQKFNDRGNRFNSSIHLILKPLLYPRH